MAGRATDTTIDTASTVQGKTVQETSETVVTKSDRPQESRNARPATANKSNASKSNTSKPSQPTPEKWTIEQSEELYRINGWGDPYFSINAVGHVTVSPKGLRGGSLDLCDLVNGLKQRNLELPQIGRAHV